MRLRYFERVGSCFAIYRMCNRELKSFQGGVIYGTLCKGRPGAERVRPATRALNECLSLLSKLKCTSLTQYISTRELRVTTRFLLLQRTLLCAASAEHRRNESGYNAGIN